MTLTVAECHHLHDADAIAGLGLVTDFSAYATSAAIPGWTERWHTTSCQNTIEDATWEFALGKVLHFDNDGFNRVLLSCDALDSVNADIEMLGLVMSDQLLNYGGRFFARASGNDGTEHAYTAYVASVLFGIHH